MDDPLTVVTIIVFLVAVSVFNWLGYKNQIFPLQIAVFGMMLLGLVFSLTNVNTALPIAALFALANAVILYMGAVR